MPRDDGNDLDPDDWLADQPEHDAPTRETPGPRRPAPEARPFATPAGRRAIAAAVVASIVVLIILVVTLGGDDPSPQAVVPSGPTDTGPVTGTEAGTGTTPEAGTGQPLQLQANGTLRAGSSGPRVRRLQRALAQLGYDVTPDGAYGPQTTDAVRNFQADADLDVDGVVGPATVRAINAALAGG